MTITQYSVFKDLVKYSIPFYEYWITIYAELSLRNACMPTKGMSINSITVSHPLFPSLTTC